MRRIGAEGEVDCTLASSPKGTRGSTQEGNTGKQETVAHYYYEAIMGKHQREGNMRQRTTASHLPSRAVTSRLSGVLVTHDDTACLYWFKLFSYSM